MVSDRHRYGEDDDRACELLETAAQRAAAAGVDLIQIRERGLDDRRLLALAKRVRQECADSGSRTLVNDRLDVALAARVDGVHLPARAMDASRVRAVVPGGFLIGRSVHDEGEAAEAARLGGCDYLVFGSVFESASKPAGHPVVGLEALARVCASVPLPVLAIGGITLRRVPDVWRAGAAGIAAIGLFATGELAELTSTVQQIRRMFQRADRDDTAS
jgi:thiamine-phosphate pyrophosphorylase